MVMWSGIQNTTTAHYKEYQLPETAKLCIDHNVWLEDNPIWRICVLLRYIQTDLITTQYIYKIWQQITLQMQVIWDVMKEVPNISQDLTAFIFWAKQSTKDSWNLWHWRWHIYDLWHGHYLPKDTVSYPRRPAPSETLLENIKFHQHIPSW